MNQENQTTVIEINGIKLEVDLRQARRIDNIRVGTRVKVLQKEYQSHKVSHGIVIGFEPFDKLPTIIIAVAKVSYNEAKIEMIHYNSATTDVEIVVSHDDELADLDRDCFVNQVDREITKKENEIKELQDRKRYFLERFQSYWEPIESAVADAMDGVDSVEV